MKLLKWIKSLFTSANANYNNWHVEAYVASKRPQNSAEVEYWIRHYEHNSRNGWAI
jgi:hypothetical protein